MAQIAFRTPMALVVPMIQVNRQWPYLETQTHSRKGRLYVALTNHLFSWKLLDRRDKTKTFMPERVNKTVETPSGPLRFSLPESPAICSRKDSVLVTTSAARHLGVENQRDVNIMSRRVVRPPLRIRRQRRMTYGMHQQSWKPAWWRNLSDCRRGSRTL